MASALLIQQLCLVSITGLMCTIGLLIQIFMVGVSVIDGLNGRPLTPADLVVTAIGTSRIIFQFLSLLYLFWITFGQKFFTTYLIVVGIVDVSSTSCNIWLSLLLSIFYSLKISNFHNVLFLFLKKIILQRVLGLVVMFVLLSIGYSTVEVLTNLVDLPENSTEEDNLHDVQLQRFKVLMFFLWNLIPLLLYVISSIALLVSLCHHLYRRRRENNVTAHLDAYYKTIRFTIVSFCCFALYVIINMFGGLFLDDYGLLLVFNCFPLLHSVYIIYMTARLRSHVFMILRGITKRLLLRREFKCSSGDQTQIIR